MVEGVFQVMQLDVLAVSDEVDQRIYTPSVRERMGDVALVIGCGDLPASYLEFIVDAVNRPVYYVLGNHAEELTRQGERGVPRHPLGCVDLGFKVVRDPGTGLILAGLPGSPRYSEREPVQFTEFQMNWSMFKMAPRLYWNKFRHGRCVDVLVTHAPPRDVNDRDDYAHRGFRAMRKFLTRFQPIYQLHGHVHLYDRTVSFATTFDETEVVNVFPYQRLTLTFKTLEYPEPAPYGLPESARSLTEAEHRP
ncbi:MAG: metallophosphoesterase [Thermomicrobiales bacterium]